ncbi:MAG TPA: Gfo/Idh/MocA family oxidoreductase [Elusimicrobiota bacterium]|nr:Gfo/Idh/MocA family oxidoreductase [Elusimicrobiota bacterium]
MKILVVGCGSIGKRHIGNFKSLGVDDIHAVETREDRRQEVKSRFGLKNIHSSLDEALKENFTAAILCSPTAYHVKQGLQLASKWTHLMIEKPLADTLEGADELHKIVKDKKLVVLMAYPFRFDPSVEKFKSLLESGCIGKALFIRGEFSEYLPDWHPWEDYRTFYMAKKAQGGGSILDQSHILDLAEWLMGDVESIACINDRLSALEVETDDFAEMLVRFRSGTVGSIHTDMLGRSHKKVMEIKGSEGNLFWDFYTYEVRAYYAAAKKWEIYPFKNDKNQMYLNESNHFLECINKGLPSRSPLEDGIRTMKTLMAAIRASEKKEVVSI